MGNTVTTLASHTTQEAGTIHSLATASLSQEPELVEAPSPPPLIASRPEAPELPNQESLLENAAAFLETLGSGARSFLQRIGQNDGYLSERTTDQAELIRLTNELTSLLFQNLTTEQEAKLAELGFSASELEDFKTLSTGQINERAVKAVQALTRLVVVNGEITISEEVPAHGSEIAMDGKAGVRTLLGLKGHIEHLLAEGTIENQDIPAGFASLLEELPQSADELQSVTNGFVNIDDITSIDDLRGNARYATDGGGWFTDEVVSQLLAAQKLRNAEGEVIRDREELLEEIQTIVLHGNSGGNLPNVPPIELTDERYRVISNKIISTAVTSHTSGQCVIDSMKNVRRIGANNGMFLDEYAIRNHEQTHGRSIQELGLLIQEGLIKPGDILSLSDRASLTIDPSTVIGGGTPYGHHAAVVTVNDAGEIRIFDNHNPNGGFTLAQFVNSYSGYSPYIHTVRAPDYSGVAVS